MPCSALSDTHQTAVASQEFRSASGHPSAQGSDLTSMLTALLDNFDILGDIYSLPGVWGADHHRFVYTMLDLQHRADLPGLFCIHIPTANTQQQLGFQLLYLLR